MVELGKGGEDVGVAGLPDPDAEIHIVEGHGVALIQAVHLVVDLLADEQAGGGVAVDVLHIVQSAHIAVGRGREVFVQVARHAADAKADAGVLDGVVRVQKLCAHAAHPLLLGVHDHFFQPARGDDLGVVVQQQQIFAGGILCPKVVQGAVVEALALPGEHLQVFRVLLLHPLIGAESLRLLGVVLNEKDLIIRVGGAGKDGLHTGLQIPDMVAGGDEDAHPARVGHGVIGLVVARGTGDEAHIVHRHAAAGVMGLEGRNACVDAVSLGRDVAGRAARAGAPVVEGMGDVGDLRRLLGEAEEEVVILAAVVLGPLAAARLFHQRPAEGGQVADIVVGAEVVQHEIGLEVVEHHILHLTLEGRFVGIDEIGPLLHDGLCGVPQRTGVEDVVVVQQGDVIAGGHLKPVVGVARNALVLLQLLVADAGVFLGTGLHMLAHRLLLPGVHAAELPIAVGLVLDGIQQLLQEIQRGVVQGHHDADLGPALAAGLAADLTHQQLHGGKAVGPQEPAREEGAVLPARLSLGPDACHALGAQLVQEDKEGEGVPDLAALAHHIAHGPGHLPEGGIRHLGQRFFQLLLVAAAEGEVAAEPLDEGGFLGAAALGPDHAVPQGVHLLLVAPGQAQHSGLRLAEQRRLLGAALAAPAKIPVIALPGQLRGPARHHGAALTDQQHLLRQLRGHAAPGRVHHHQQVGRRGPFGPGVCPDAGAAQRLFQQVALGVQHCGRLRVHFLRNALCQLAAALLLLLQLCFLIPLHSDFSNFPFIIIQTCIVYQIPPGLRSDFPQFFRFPAF